MGIQNSSPLFQARAMVFPEYPGNVKKMSRASLVNIDHVHSCLLGHLLLDIKMPSLDS